MKNVTTVTIYQLAAALNCTERNVRDREGRTLPLPISDGKPRLYSLVDVLWKVDGAEREQICRLLGIPPAQMRALFESAVEPDDYFPGDDGRADDPLMY